MLERLRRAEGLEYLKQRLVDDDCAILGIAGDKRQLVGMQARVQRMDHGTHQRHGVVQLEVLRLVPQQRRDTVPIANPEIGEAARHPAGPIGAFPEMRWIAPSGRRETTLRPALKRSARSTSAVSESG